jgi:hypothetical protein
LGESSGDFVDRLGESSGDFVDRLGESSGDFVDRLGESSSDFVDRLVLGMVGDGKVGASRGGKGSVGRVLKIELDCVKK